MADYTKSTDSYIAPVWQLPVNADGIVPKSAKYHCFVCDSSLCGRKMQDTSFYDWGITAKSDIAINTPDLVCKRCLKLWRQRYLDGGDDNG